jgi:alkylhydroperoxidase family enzyme
MSVLANRTTANRRPETEYAEAQRQTLRSIGPQAHAAMRRLDDYVRQCGLETSLLGLVKIRVSEINNCPRPSKYTENAHAAEETEQQLHDLSAWQQLPFFTDRERAALEWSEALMRNLGVHLPPAIEERARRQFAHKELVDLTIAVIAIDGWNRLMTAFGSAVFESRDSLKTQAAKAAQTINHSRPSHAGKSAPGPK